MKTTQKMTKKTPVLSDDKPQVDKFKDLARELETNEDEAAFDLALKKVAKSARADAKVCPECGHVFQGNGWDGIDAHWKAKHENIMPYAEAWPLLSAGIYVAKG